MDDISTEADGSLTAGGMLAGGVAGTQDAMAAPGSEPTEPLAGREDPAVPDVRADRGDYRHLVHGERGEGGAAWS